MIKRGAGQSEINEYRENLEGESVNMYQLWMGAKKQNFEAGVIRKMKAEMAQAYVKAGVPDARKKVRED